MTIKRLGAILALSLAAQGAQAATITLTHFETYKRSELQTARADRAAIDGLSQQIALETFDRFVPMTANNDGNDSTANTPEGLPTSVGTFDVLASNRAGGSALKPYDRGLIRTGQNYGRYDTTSGQGNWLDSNDNVSILLDTATANLSAFNTLSFFLTDVDDAGAVSFSLTARANDTVYNFDIASDIFGDKRQKNRALFFVNLAFDTTVSDVALDLSIDGSDGFGIDDVRAGLKTPNSGVTPVPLPASLPLLAGAFIGLGFWARRRKT
ncbi:MAG: VPLPA-CTERM sorting domain-containing protein [Pseudomonadota bacterium]